MAVDFSIEYDADTDDFHAGGRTYPTETDAFVAMSDPETSSYEYVETSGGRTVWAEIVTVDPYWT